MKTFTEYQEWTKSTAVYPKSPDHALAYLTLKLNGEAGEVAEKVGKWYRGEVLAKDSLALELGDVLWYVSELATFLGYSLESIAQLNRIKLESRVTRNKVLGDGDDR